jgi:hypothetical protein
VGREIPQCLFVVHATETAFADTRSSPLHVHQNQIECSCGIALKRFHAVLRNVTRSPIFVSIAQATSLFTPNRVAQQLHQLPRNEKAKTDASKSPRGGRVGLRERFEDRCRLLSGIPIPETSVITWINDFIRLHALLGVDVDGNLSSLGELRCGTEEIMEDLPSRSGSVDI